MGWVWVWEWGWYLGVGVVASSGLAGPSCQPGTKPLSQITVGCPQHQHIPAPLREHGVSPLQLKNQILHLRRQAVTAVSVAVDLKQRWQRRGA